MEIEGVFMQFERPVLGLYGGTPREITDHLAVRAHIVGIPSERQALEPLHGPDTVGMFLEQVGNIGHRIHIIPAVVDFFRQLESDALRFRLGARPVFRIGVGAIHIL